MSEESDLIGLIDLIHEALLDGNLWPSVLAKIADAAGANQIGMSSRDQQTGKFTILAPRTDPQLIASYAEYWRHHNPLWQATVPWPAGKTYTLDELMPREAFSRTPVYNEWWRPSGRGLAAIGANILADGHFSALIYIANRPEADDLTARQISVFNAALRHIIWAARINRRLWDLELKHLAPPEQFESLPHGALLVDASAHVVHANAAGKAMLEAGDGLTVRNGRLSAVDRSEDLRELVLACGRCSGADSSPGWAVSVRRPPPRPALHVTVTPLGMPTRLTPVPWFGVGVPVALVTLGAPEASRRRQRDGLCRRYGFTIAEAALAVEILKGDGRRAAARRCHVSDGTAKTHLANIFAKTGTRRQAELVRVLLEDAAPPAAGGFGRAAASANPLPGSFE
jgi:DNA-binding CsgD family transcriptional regulator